MQQVAVVFQLGRQGGFDAREGRECIGRQAALVADLREEVPRPVAHRRRRALVDELREELPGLHVHAVRQQQATAQHLGFIGMPRHAGELLRGHQRGQRSEVVRLVEVEQRVAVVRVLDGARGGICQGRCRRGGVSRDGTRARGGHGHLPQQCQGERAHVHR